MNKVIIGVDPDSKDHGIAVYIAGELVSLKSKSLMMTYETLVTKLIPMTKSGEFVIEVHIEDVCGMNAVFRQRQTQNNNVNMKMSNSVGRCQQSQIELERMFQYFGVKIVRHKISKMWKKDKAQFEKVTGWTGRSNEDTRSASYFGYLGLK